VHITKKENFYHYSEDKKQIKATKEELKELWQEVVLLAEAPEEHTEKAYPKFLQQFLLAFLWFFFWVLFIFLRRIYFLLFSVCYLQSVCFCLLKP
jgi:ABC-type bacteriocin/lantibiotic exporter with double-glycine peptidase domain